MRSNQKFKGGFIMYDLIMMALAAYVVLIGVGITVVMLAFSGWYERKVAKMTMEIDEEFGRKF